MILIEKILKYNKKELKELVTTTDSKIIIENLLKCDEFTKNEVIKKLGTVMDDAYLNFVKNMTNSRNEIQ